MIDIRVMISEPMRRLRKAAPLPQVECTEAEARHWFAGYWHGIGLGIVLGLGSGVIAGWLMGIM